MMSPEKALKMLKDGNERFWKGDSIHPNRSAELRGELLNEQKPFAVVIACSDSRVPVEIIFDVGLGDLFVIRTAGHVLSKESMGSLEYAVQSLGVKLVLILGHDNCGAVESAMEAYKTRDSQEVSENLQALLSHIYPVFEKIDLENNCALDGAIVENIHYQIEDLKQKDAYIAQKVKNGELNVVGAKYSLCTGMIEFYDKKEAVV